MWGRARRRGSVTPAKTPVRVPGSGATRRPGSGSPSSRTLPTAPARSRAGSTPSSLRRADMARPWLIRMRWLDLLFAHWPVAPAPLERLIPPQLELERFEDRAWLGIVPFTMDDVAPRGVPTLGRFGTFPELNVRTYVRRRDRPADRGVWFLSLDAGSWTTVWGSRA